MPRLISFTMELTDAEHANFLARLAERGTPDDDEDGDTGGEGTATSVPGEVDAKGAPWLAEVHSGKKSKNADGTWRLKRGVNQATADAAVAKASANQPQTAPQSMPTGAAANPLVSPTPAATMPTGLPSGMPAATGLPGLPQTAPAPEPVSYDQIVAKYNELAGSGRVTMDAIGGIYASAGVTDPNELTTNETLRRKLMDELNKIG